MAGKQDVLGYVPDEDPSSYQILKDGVIRALKVSSPLVATADATQVHVSLDPAALNPFWCAGKVGTTGAVLANRGRVSFTTTKTSLGQWTVTFATPHPSANNVVAVTSHGYVYLSSSTATGFGVVLKNFAFDLADAQFHFTVLA